MQDHTLAERLLQKQGYTVFEYLGDSKFEILTPPPDWLAKFEGAKPFLPGPFPLIEKFSFLENFLVDAEILWKHPSDEIVESGVWTERSPSGEEICLEAAGLWLGSKKVMFVRSPQIPLDEQRRWVQTGREALLQADLSREALRKSEKELYRLFGLSGDLLFVAGLDGYIKRVNPAFEKVLGFTLEELQTKPYIELVHPSERDLIVSTQKLLAAGQVAKGLENQLVCKDGSYKWVSWNAVPFVEEGEFYGSARDITEMKRNWDSLRRYDFMANSVREMMTLINRDYSYEAVNRAWCTAMGRSRDESEGRTVAQTWGDRAFDSIRPRLDQCFGGQVVRNESWMELPAQGRRYCESTFLPFAPKDAEVTHAVVVTRDLTEHKLAEDALRESERIVRERTEALEKSRSEALEAMQDANLQRQRAEETLGALRRSEAGLAEAQRIAMLGSWDSDLTGNDVSWSDQIYRILGLEPHHGSPSHQALWARVDPSDLESVKKAFDEALRESKPLSFDHRVICPDGTVRIVRQTVEVTRDHMGTPARIFGTVQDITERERMERKLISAMNAADAANRAKSAFLAAMSHEIRTPMNGVVGMIDLLTQTPLTAGQRQMTNTISDSAFALLQVIDDILDFSKIEAGKLKLERVPISIRDIVEGVVETLAANAAKKNLKLELYVDPAIPEWVEGDQVRLRQILFNLGGNAIKFTSNKEGQRGWVWIRAEWNSRDGADNPALRLQISDNGVGIAKEAQARLFQPFEQAESSTTRRFGGTGLGLAICSSLTELMGGVIGLVSVPGEGSVFTVDVPLQEPKEMGIPSDIQNLTGLKILIAAQDSETQDTLRAYLRWAGAEVEVVGSLEEIKNQSELTENGGSTFDIIVLGSEWAKAHKDELRNSFRECPNFPNLRFVVLAERAERATHGDYPDTVLVESNPTRRSSFLKGVAFAAGRASPNVDVQDDFPLVQEEEIPTLQEAEAKGELVLVAEDNTVNQDILVRQLNLLGYAAELASNGKEALDVWRRKKFGLLLSDCHMPQMDGYELTQAIRTAEQGTVTRLPIVAITANALKGEADRCLAVGMDDYLAKPVQLSRLKGMMEKWLPKQTEPAQVVAPGLEPGNRERQELPPDPLLDPSALTKLVGDDAILQRRFLKKFADTAPAVIRDIHEAYSQHSASQVSNGAHKLKSSARAVGANQLADLCESVERAARAENWLEITSLEPQLAEVMARLGKLFQDLISGTARRAWHT